MYVSIVSTTNYDVSRRLRDLPTMGKLRVVGTNIEFSLYILNLCDLKNKKIEGDLKSGKKTALELALQPTCLLYTSPSPRDLSTSRMPSSA